MGMDDESGSRWTAMVGQYERPLLAYALRLVGGDMDRARDVVQETFTKLLRQPRGEESGGENGHLPQWLYTVCRHAAVDARRKEKRMTPMLDTAADSIESSGAPPDQVAETKDSTSHVLKLLARLPENQQEVIRLKFQHGMSYRQISGITGHSEPYVGFLIHSGIKTIRSKMQIGTADERG
jgi:RNA polymerase sigma-70 factor (ECF subfamily)